MQDRRNRGPEARLFGVPDWVQMVAETPKGEPRGRPFR